MNIGTASKSTVGNGYDVPNTWDYFKLFIECEVQVNKVNIYKQITPNSPKVLDSVYYIESLYSRTGWVIAQ